MHDPVGAQPFEVSIPESVLDDLKERLKKTRWPLEANTSPWTYGASLSYMKDICAYWCDHYDWRKAESLINKYPNYLVNLRGKNVHFIIEKGYDEDRYNNGEKFMIKRLEGKTIIIDEEIDIELTDDIKVKWCLGKDDVSPNDIFNFQSRNNRF